MDLPRISPAAAGISEEGIRGFLNGVAERGIELHDLMLVRGGKVCYEASWYPYEKDRLHMIYSLSKAFTAIGVGFAVQEGHLFVEDTVYSFFQDELLAEIGEGAKRITVEHLLTMCTGQEEEPPILNYEFSGNWVEKFLKIEPEYEPGTHFFYDTTATYVLSAIVTKVTGEKLADYLRERFFEPLGIEDYYWDESPQGNSLGGIGFNVTIETVAKLGVFLRQQGMWNGKQLLNRGWVERMTSNLVDSSGGEVYSDGNEWGVGYGYQIWQCIPKGVYRGDGAYGQFAVVAPQQDLVIATLTGTEDMAGLMAEMWKHLLPACMDVEKEQFTDAGSKKEQFMIAFPEGDDAASDSEKRAERLRGARGTYVLADNEEHLARVHIDAGNKKDVIDITCVFSDGTKRTLSYGYRSWETNDLPGVRFSNYYTCADIRIVNTAGAYNWQGSTLKLKLCYPHNPLGVTAEFEFLDGAVRITAKKSRCMDRKMEYSFDGVFSCMKQ